MTRKLDGIAAAAALSAAGGAAATGMALLVRQPCPEGCVRFLDIVPAAAVGSAVLALSLGLRAIRGRGTRWVSVTLLVVSLLVGFIGVDTVSSDVASPTGDCWSAF